MFRRFEVTTGNNPDRSGGFNGLAFLRCLLCCRITGFLCATAIPFERGAQAFRVAEPASRLARSPMWPTKRLTALVSKLSTVRMIDELSLHLSAYARFQTNMGQGGRARRMFATALVGTWRSAVLACLIGITLAASEAKLGPLVQLLRGSRAFARVINRTDRKP